MNENMYKIFAGLVGGLVGIFVSIAPLVIVCFLFVLADMWSAYQLNKRISIKAKKEGIELNKDDGKFRTSRAKRIIKTMIDIASLILLSYLLDTKVLEHFNGLFLANYTAGVFCFLQMWSILENSSSCNGSTWAKLLQKIMVDKTERHFNIDLSDLKEKLKNTKEDE